MKTFINLNLMEWWPSGLCVRFSTKYYAFRDSILFTNIFLQTIILLVGPGNTRVIHVNFMHFSIEPKLIYLNQNQQIHWNQELIKNIKIQISYIYFNFNYNVFWFFFSVHFTKVAEDWFFYFTLCHTEVVNTISW